MLLRTLQHLTWILGLVPTDNGQLVPSPNADGANVVRTSFPSQLFIVFQDEMELIFN